MMKSVAPAVPAEWVATEHRTLLWRQRSQKAQIYQRDPYQTEVSNSVRVINLYSQNFAGQKIAAAPRMMATEPERWSRRMMVDGTLAQTTILKIGPHI